MSKALDSQRTYALIGTGGCGKTSLAEMLLFQSGVINRLGAIEEGTTTLDYEPEEIKRRGSIQPGFATFLWNKDRHFLMDVPGDTNFTGDLPYLLMGVDAAVLVIDAVDGVRPLTRRIWNAVREAGLPSFVFINKMDRDRADFDMAFNGLSSVLGMKPVTLYMPVMTDGVFTGVVDILGGKALMFGENGAVTEALIPDAIADEAALLHDTTVENIAESDEELMEKYLGGEELTEAEIKGALRQRVLNNEIILVTCGSAFKNKGVQAMLDAVIDYLPSPVDVPAINGILDDGKDTPAERHASDDEPFSALAFKIATDPFVGNLTFFRVYSGVVNSGDTVLNSVKAARERFGRIVQMHANKREEIKEVRAGDIAAAIGLKDVTTGDTLCDPDAPIILERMEFPEPVISIAVEPKTKADQEKMGLALGRLAKEDPSFRVWTDEESNQTIIAGMGELHLDIIVDRMKREFNVEANVGKPQVAYREAIRAKVTDIEGKHAKQSGGRGQYGHVVIDMYPLEPGSNPKGYEFINDIKGGVIPGEYIPAVDKGIQEQLKAGPLAGYPVVDMGIRLHFGSYHDVDSSELAFKLAASIAFKEGFKKAKPVLLEPIMKVEVETPEENTGDVIGDLSRRRGMLKGQESEVTGVKIHAEVPLSEMFGYATQLRSLTKGRASYTMEFLKYDDAPNNVAQAVIEARGK